MLATLFLVRVFAQLGLYINWTEKTGVLSVVLMIGGLWNHIRKSYEDRCNKLRLPDLNIRVFWEWQKASHFRLSAVEDDRVFFIYLIFFAFSSLQAPWCVVDFNLFEHVSVWLNLPLNELNGLFNSELEAISFFGGLSYHDK